MGLFFLLESRTNNGTIFNFIGIKKNLRVFPNFFLKAIQIIFFLLYIKKKFKSGWFWDHPTLNVAPPLKQQQVNKLFNKNLIIKQRDKICNLSNLFNKNNLLFHFFLKKWYQEKYCGCEFSLMVTTVIVFLVLQSQQFCSP